MPQHVRAQYAEILLLGQGVEKSPPTCPGALGLDARVVDKNVNTAPFFNDLGYRLLTASSYPTSQTTAITSSLKASISLPD